MHAAMHTVVETPMFLRDAKAVGMSDADRLRAIDLIAADPEAGDLIAGGGGVRKVRVPKAGRGKSGGYRVITYYMDEDEPVYLPAVLAKNEKANFSDAEKKSIRDEAKSIKKA